MERTFWWVGLLVLTTGGCSDALGFDEYKAVCEPGTEEACYSGPAGTEGVGPCKAGVHACNSDGSAYGTCAGEVTPVAEDCATGADESCNGETLDVDAGCVCKPGTQASCYTGPPDTEGVGVCKAGMHTCDDTGKRYGACGDVLPKVELCDTPAVDENCDDKAKCTGEHLWSKGFGDEKYQFVNSIAVDGAGNIIVTGHFAGSVTFGGDMLTSAGGYGIFVAKFDSALNHLWSKGFGDEKYQSGNSIAVDGAGNIIVTGDFAGSVTFGGDILTSAGGYDIFVAKFDSALNHLWSKGFGNMAYQRSKSVAVDSDGNVVLTGGYEGSVNFGGDTDTLTSAGGYDIFVAKFDSELNHRWSKSFGDAEEQAGSGIAVDGAGDVVLAGGFRGSVDFGAGALNNPGGSDVFVAKLAADYGEHLWSKGFGDANVQSAASVAVDGAGNVVLTGVFLGSVDFGGGSLDNPGANDVFVAKLDADDGEHLWSKGFGDANVQSAASVAVDGAGNVVLTGDFLGSVDFGGGSLDNPGGNDVFIAKLDADDGKHLWSERFGDANTQYCNSIAVDGAGNVVLTGDFYGVVDFGSGPLSSAGGNDIFVTKLAP